MSKKGTMAPVFEEGVPAALCTKSCGRWKKIKGEDTKIVCLDQDGKQAEVALRAVCVPWLEILMRSNDSMAKLIRDGHQRQQDVAEQEKMLRSSLEELREEKSSVVREAVKAKGEVVRLKKELARKDEMIAEERKQREKVDAKAERAMKQNQEVRDFAKDKVRHESELARVQKDASRVKDLEKLNAELLQTKKTQEHHLKQYSRQAEALTKRVRMLQAVEEMLHEEKKAKERALSEMASVVDKKEARRPVSDAKVTEEQPGEKVL